jgi:type IV secretion system protein TrbL
MGKVLLTGTLLWLLTQWPTLMSDFIDSCIAWGLVAGGGGITSADFRSPGNIFTLGIEVFMVLLTQATQIGGLLDIPRALLMGGVTILLGIIILLAYTILMFQVAVALLEFYLGASISILLLPFGVFRPLAFLAEKTIGYVIASGIKLVVLSFIVGVTRPFLEKLSLGTGAPLVSLQTVQDTIGYAIGVCFIAYFAWKGPAIAGGLLGGGPALAASSAIQSVVSAGAVVAAAVASGGAALGAGIAGARGVTALGAAYQQGGVAAAGRLAGAGARSLASNTLARFTQSGAGAVRRVGQSIPHDAGYHGGLSGRL